MNLSNLIAALKEFFLEILGYLLPGLYVILIFILVANEKLSEKIIDLQDKAYVTYLLIGLGYILGYVVYGISLVRDKVLRAINGFFDKWKFLRKLKFTHPNDICKKIENSNEFKESRKIIEYLITKKKQDKKWENKVNSLQGVRSLAMSYIPDADKKIYTFMFRAELSNHISTISLFFALIGFISCIIHCFIELDLFKYETNYLILYSILLFVSYFLDKTRFRFYAIAMKIVFPLFIIEFYKKINDE